jgi:hypothetical protein
LDFDDDFYSNSAVKPTLPQAPIPTKNSVILNTPKPIPQSKTLEIEVSSLEETPVMKSGESSSQNQDPSIKALNGSNILEKKVISGSHSMINSTTTFGNSTLNNMVKNPQRKEDGKTIGGVVIGSKNSSTTAPISAKNSSSKSEKKVEIGGNESKPVQVKT